MSALATGRARGMEERGEGDAAAMSSPYDYVRVLVRRWRLIVITPLVAGLFAVALALMLPKQWTATTQIVAESSGSSGLPAGLGALAGQFGVSLPRASSEQSPDFYVALVRSRELEDSLLLSRLPVAGRRDSLAVLELLPVVPDEPARRLARGRTMLSQMIAPRVDPKTNMIRIDVTARSAELAAALANRTVALLNQFNLSRRATQAHQRRTFVEDRAREADQQLRAAESEVQDFLSRNRDFRNAPSLNFAFERLQRQVQVRQEVYLTLRRELETSRIQEVNDAPVLTVVDVAVPPVTRSSPARARIVIIAVIFGGLFALVLAYVLDYLEQLGARDPVGRNALTRALRESRVPFFGRGSPNASA